MSNSRKNSDRHNNIENMRNLNSAPKIRNLGNPGLGFSRIDDSPGTDPVITTDIHMKWNGESRV